LLGDIAPLVLISIVMAVVGVLIALWPWQDGENIKILDEEVA
jgi:hypothetical protein